jgi:hypothetical protein
MNLSLLDVFPQAKYIPVEILLGSRPMHCYLPDNLNYQQAKNFLASHIRAEATFRYVTKTKGHTQASRVNQRNPKVKYLRLATAALRELKDKGLVLRMPSHSLEYYSTAPTVGDPSCLEPYWSQDPIFRAVCPTVMTGSGSWEDLKIRALDAQMTTLKAITKPWRRDLATGRISYAVARCLANGRSGCPDYHTTPRWAVSSARIYTNWERWRKMDGMSRIKHRSLLELMKLHDDLPQLIERGKRAGVRTPRTLEGYRRYDRDAHNKESALYLAITNSRSVPDLQMLSSLPEMPALTGGAPDSMRIIWKREQLLKEGKEMGHCVGLYTGAEALFVSVRRGEDRVTLMVGKNGYSQCYGRFNKVTELSRKINAIWVPFLLPIVQGATPVLFHREPALTPEYQ